MNFCHPAERILRARLFSALFVTAVFAAVMPAQTVNAVISGTVTDPSKSPVPAAAVTIINADTGVMVWNGQTNDSGVYRAPNLPPGRYNVSVQAGGFKQQKVSAVQLAVDQRADVSFTLQVGEVAETVNVEGSSEGQLATDTSSLGNTITPSQVQDLPLPSRNVLNLLALTPGVSSGGDISSQGGLNSAQLSINGSRTLNSEFLIDGVSVVTGSTGSPQTLPPADSIREFRVLTSSYSAEYGRTSGGIVTLITNSGTNDWHGAAYGYFRNEDLDANNYFNNLLGSPRSEDRYNLFGGKLGGPLSVPKIYNGKNRTFFFINYEGLRQASPYNLTSTIPYGAYAAGNFSASPILVDDPITKRPFANNTIPSNRIDPAAQKILSLLPAPNSPGTLNNTDNLVTNNYVSIGSSHPETNTGVARLDESISDTTRVFWTFVHFNNFSPTQPALPGSPLENQVGPSQTTGYESTAGLTRTWKPTLITEVRFAFFRNNSEITPPTLGINTTAVFGIARSYGTAAPTFNINGFTTAGTALGTNSNTLRTQIDNNYQTTVTTSKSWGNHLIQFGGELRKNEFDDFNPTSDVNGSYTFDGSISSARNTTGEPVNSLADFLLGAVKTNSYSLPQPLIGRRNYNLGLFLQDDWKIRPNLTLNLGLRWEYESPVATANNEYSRVDPTTGHVLFAGRNASRTLNLTASKLNFGPRVGFAYSASPKTVVRAGFGIFYSQLFSLLGGQVLFPGYNVEQPFNNLGTGVPQPFTLSQGIPSVATNNPQNPQANIAQFNSPSNPLTLSAYDGFTQVSPLPAAQEWNLGVQQQIGRGTLLDLNYVGSHGVHLAVNLPTNTVPYNPALDTAVAFANTTLTTQLARPYPTIGSFNSLNMEATSSYNAFQASVHRQYGQNLAFIGNYVWSKSIDNASGTFSFSQPSGLNLGQFPQQFLNLNRGLSEFDRTHVFTAAIQYRTKGNRWIRNFEFYPMLTAQTGLPMYIGQSNVNPAQTGSNQQRPNDINPSVSLYTVERPNGTGVQYLLPVSAANFPLVPVGPYFTGSGAARTLAIPAGIGTLGRNVVRAPGQLNFNISLGRAFELTEKLKFTLRVEAYNAINHTNFKGPSSTLSLASTASGQPFFNSPDFGLITGANQSRFLQLAARFDF
ncbi:MAG: TonB-dependent receptor [Acidobacteriaceae bacterium]|nr:TonB-dependent receptor [Acidobacteriaceae bacterium]